MESEFAKIQLSEPLLAGSFIDGRALNLLTSREGKTGPSKTGGLFESETQA